MGMHYYSNIGYIPQENALPIIESLKNPKMNVFLNFLLVDVQIRTNIYGSGSGRPTKFPDPAVPDAEHWFKYVKNV